MSDSECEILIVGGGLVGSALALALLAAGREVTLVEARNPTLLEQDSFDDRISALALGSQRILESLKLWPALTEEAQAIQSIHVSERGRFGAARLEAHAEGVAALGYTIANRVLGQALWQVLDRKHDGFRCLAPAQLLALRHEPAAVRATVEHNGEQLELRCRLVVAADGQRSQVRRWLGIPATEDRYGQHAITFNCVTAAAHEGRAFERFTPEGPLAMLPITRGRSAAVWTLPDAMARAAMAYPDTEFRERFQRAFGYRLGRIEHCGQRTEYPLVRVRSASVVAPRCVLLGNAALCLHPVAGQSFNLALRDVAVLAELLADDAGSDAGAERLLADYAEARKRDQAGVALFTHSLVHLFTNPRPVGAALGIGLAMFDVAPGAKTWLAKRNMGLGLRPSRLARGLSVADG